MKNKQLTEFMKFMEQNQYFIGNDLLTKYKELLEDTEWNETVKNSSCQNHALEQEEQELWENIINDCVMSYDVSSSHDIIECLKEHYKVPKKK